MKASDFLIQVPTTGWKRRDAERVNREKLICVAGTKITCPKCKDTIGRISIPIYSGMRIPADSIEFEKHQKRHPNQKAECTRCKTGYMRHWIAGGLKTKVHSEVGWI